MLRRRRITFDRLWMPLRRNGPECNGGTTKCKENLLSSHGPLPRDLSLWTFAHFPITVPYMSHSFLTQYIAKWTSPLRNAPNIWSATWVFYHMFDLTVTSGLRIISMNRLPLWPNPCVFAICYHLRHVWLYHQFLFSFVDVNNPTWKTTKSILLSNYGTGIPHSHRTRAIPVSNLPILKIHYVLVLVKLYRL